MKHKQTGFTLVEIAIVLVIIGLLLGGVLKGQELINSAKVKNLATDFKAVPVYIYGYQDKFRALPGDDAGAVTHLGGTPAVGNGNGIIAGAWDSTTSTDESYIFWQHVRLAGLAPGSTTLTDPAYLPKNADGGPIGVSSTSPFTTLKGSQYMCSGAILGKYVKQLDATLDDGETSTGSFQAALVTAPATVVTTANIVDSSSYNLCAAF